MPPCLLESERFNDMIDTRNEGNVSLSDVAKASSSEEESSSRKLRRPRPNDNDSPEKKRIRVLETQLKEAKEKAKEVEEKAKETEHRIRKELEEKAKEVEESDKAQSFLGQMRTLANCHLSLIEDANWLLWEHQRMVKVTLRF